MSKRESSQTEVDSSSVKRLRQILEDALKEREDAGARLAKAREKEESARNELSEYMEQNGVKDARYRELDQEVKDAKEDVKEAQRWLKQSDDMLQRSLSRSSAQNTGVLASYDASMAGRASQVQYNMSLFAPNLMTRIRGVESDSIFNVGTFVQLPFPSLSRPPIRFHVVDDCFSYQGRADLQSLYERVVNLWKKGLPITVKVAGTIGYGKSHMLAALVVLLMKNPPENVNGISPLVCYIPDCRVLLGGDDRVISVLKQCFLLNRPNFSGPLDTIQQIRQAMRNEMAILVADQWNAIDNGDKWGEEAKKLLDSCFGTAAFMMIHGISITTKSWRELSYKQTSDDRNIYHGGFRDDEFAVWLRRQPKIFQDNELELASLTGKVPLFLSAFEHAYQDGASWEEILLGFENQQIVTDCKIMLGAYYANVDDEHVWKVFTLSVEWFMDESFVDLRFFYRDPEFGLRATAGIVLRLLYRVWSDKVAHDALLKRWRELLDIPHNRSALGFFVEEIVKAKICSEGLRPPFPRPNDVSIKRRRFTQGTEKSELERATKRNNDYSWWSLLDPDRFNYPGVDMILINKEAIIGIKVTIAKTHSSMEPFFNIWRPLAELHAMSIKAIIVAPDDFCQTQMRVDVVFFDTVYHELWIEIAPQTKRPIQDYTCKCLTGCDMD